MGVVSGSVPGHAVEGLAEERNLVRRGLDALRGDEAGDDFGLGRELGRELLDLRVGQQGQLPGGRGLHHLDPRGDRRLVAVAVMKLGGEAGGGVGEVGLDQVAHQHLEELRVLVGVAVLVVVQDGPGVVELAAPREERGEEHPRGHRAILLPLPLVELEHRGRELAVDTPRRQLSAAAARRYLR